MEKTGPILIVLALIVDVVSAVGWLLFGDNTSAVMALEVGLVLGAVFVYGGSWLTILFGEVSRDLFVVGVFALIIHLVAAVSVAFLSGAPLASAGIAALSAASVAALIPGAWRTTESGSGEEQPTEGQ